MENFVIMGSQLPPGFRFHPTDQKLIIHYLSKKITSSLISATSIIADIDYINLTPGNFPAFFGEDEWFFLSPRDQKYPNGTRPNRAAASGYWKATGIDNPILSTGGSKCLGVKKSIVFYKGRSPKGIKTDWIMHEYRLLDVNAPSSLSQKHKGSMRDDLVLCRVRQRGSHPSETVEQNEKVSTNLSCRQNAGQEEADVQGTGHLFEWNENQLFYYLTSLQEEGGASTAGSYSSESLSTRDMVGCGYAAEPAQPLQVVSSVLDSVKRKLSFGALDELMLLPPNKRVHYTHNVCEQSSSVSSSSVDQAVNEFIIV